MTVFVFSPTHPGWGFEKWPFPEVNPYCGPIFLTWWISRSVSVSV